MALYLSTFNQNSKGSKSVMQDFAFSQSPCTDECHECFIAKYSGLKTLGFQQTSQATQTATPVLYKYKDDSKTETRPAWICTPWTDNIVVTAFLLCLDVNLNLVCNVGSVQTCQTPGKEPGLLVGGIRRLACLCHRGLKVGLYK